MIKSVHVGGVIEIHNDMFSVAVKLKLYKNLRAFSGVSVDKTICS